MKINGIKDKLGVNSAEEIVSMFLGLLVVVVVIGLVVNFVQKRRGSIDIPGISSFENLSLSDNSGQGSGEDRVTVDGNTYEVVAGDSLWRIAENKLNNGYAWKDIASLNNIENVGLIEVGQKLLLPKMEQEGVQESERIVSKITEGEKYTVVKGDHLWKLAVAAYGDGFRWVNIWEANKSQVVNPSEIEIGMVLEIPRIETSSVIE